MFSLQKVYVMRNPKDAFVSHIMLTKYFKQVDPDVDIGELLDSYLDGQSKGFEYNLIYSLLDCVLIS